VKPSQETPETYEPEPTPDLVELLQNDERPDMSTVPVKLAEAGTFWPLPNRRVRIDEQDCDAIAWIQIADGSKKRSRGTLICATNPMRIRVSTSGVGMAWPVGLPYTFTHTQAVFVQATTAVSTIGITEEFWAD
jgi:hypothetical protein